MRNTKCTTTAAPHRETRAPWGKVPAAREDLALEATATGLANPSSEISVVGGRAKDGQPGLRKNYRMTRGRRTSSLVQAGLELSAKRGLPVGVLVAWGLLVCAGCAPDENDNSAATEAAGDATSETSSEEPGDALETAREYYARFGNMVCAYQERCREATQCRVLSLEEAYGSSNFTFDREQAAACLEALNEAACGELNKVLALSCGSVLEGAGKQSDACVSGWDCGAGLYCANSVQCPGTCQPRAKLGEDCEQPCDGRTYCGSEGKCVPQAQEGEDCASAECEFWLSCQEDTCEDLNKRVPRQLGESCGSTDPCDDDSYCDAESETCQARHEPGAACVSGSCASGYYCGDDATCEPRFGEGDECTSVGQCSTALCFDGKCRERGAVGEDCVEIWDCMTFVCGASGKCLPAGGCE